MVAPLVVLLIRRLQGVPWSEQPEVWVIENSATRLLHTGSPYLDLATLGRPPIVDDYTPYGVAMSVFGIPHALFGLSALTDGRVAFGVVSALIVLVALRVLGCAEGAGARGAADPGVSADHVDLRGCRGRPGDRRADTARARAAVPA